MCSVNAINKLEKLLSFEIATFSSQFQAYLIKYLKNETNDKFIYFLIISIQ